MGYIVVEGLYDVYTNSYLCANCGKHLVTKEYVVKLYDRLFNGDEPAKCVSTRFKFVCSECGRCNDIDVYDEEIRLWDI